MRWSPGTTPTATTSTPRRATRDLVGYEPEELIGRSGYEFIHPGDLDDVRSAHAALLNGERPGRGPLPPPSQETAPTPSARRWRGRSAATTARLRNSSSSSATPATRSPATSCGASGRSASSGPAAGSRVTDARDRDDPLAEPGAGRDARRHGRRLRRQTAAHALHRRSRAELIPDVRRTLDKNTFVSYDSEHVRLDGSDLPGPHRGDGGERRARRRPLPDRLVRRPLRAPGRRAPRRARRARLRGRLPRLPARGRDRRPRRPLPARQPEARRHRRLPERAAGRPDLPGDHPPRRPRRRPRPGRRAARRGDRHLRDGEALLHARGPADLGAAGGGDRPRRGRRAAPLHLPDPGHLRPASGSRRTPTSSPTATRSPRSTTGGASRRSCAGRSAAAATRARARRCCCSTSTASRTSTTPTATSPATS